MTEEKEILRSRQNPTVKWAASLADGKGRNAARAFLAEGEKLTHEAALSHLPVSHLLVAESAYDRLIDGLRADFAGETFAATRLICLSDDAFSKISTEKSPQGVISVIKYLDFFKELDIIIDENNVFLPGDRVLALYAMRDPGNLGSVIRSAVAFGVTHLVLSADCADLYHPRTVRSAMGSLFRVKATVVSDMASLIPAASRAGRRVLAAELTENAVSLSDAALVPSDIVMIGNEGHGIPKELSALCAASVYIPISAKTESLNAAVAAAVFMWEQSKI